MSTNNSRPSKAERNASAREKAAQLQAAQASAQKRKSLFVKLGVLAAVVLVVVLVVVLIVQNNNAKVPDAGAAPQGGNAAGGILLTSPTTVANTSGVKIDNTKLVAPDSKPATPEPRDLTVGAKGEPINVTLFVDANCVHCAEFESKYGPQMKQWLADGKISLEYRNVGFLDGNSPTNFSSRGANALACVADQSPAAYLDFASALWGHYDQGEMKNAEISEMAIAAGASDSVKSCIDKGTYRPFVETATLAAGYDGVLGTPSIFIQGEVMDLANQDFVEAVEAAIKANA
ncbi:thioredoxin [Arthrobacter sp. MYb211]|uniref:DsbA family protein n=1 Tax=Micrococcaceae TaxID=1268 RepID=UPI000BB8855A|nr:MULTISPECIES: thioredoxin domain-containing protein [Micrococcaceae]PCC27226.1 thioredoxin [Glutamicibacter sp. BW80]PQZ97402.1 thioredoxin [Arthrobacter sp. MYb224]PRA00809.1 thioredoxin [Arthrobacter sp. MYb229]PRA10757.1 thioredoxin [Arthrobacter sp. MYb221]PRB48743.1 thioredoxin [Arthrobacter sp. MYb216]